MPIPYGRQSIDEADVRAVADVLRSDRLTQGPAVAAFEEAFAAACDAPYAVAFSSGTAGLHAACHAAGVGPGDAVVTSAITFAASANCAAYLGATPRYADIEPTTWNVSARTVAAAAEGARAVIPVHFAGLPVDVAGLRAALGDKVAIIEDAAHAAGAASPDGPVGSCRHSDMAVFSFHPVKAITTGEGGMVTTRDRELRDRLAAFRTHGLAATPLSDEEPWVRGQEELGFNYRLTDIQSALGRSQLGRLDAFVARRNAIAGRYREALADAEALELPPAAPGGWRHAYHLFVVRHREGAAARRALYDRLLARGVLVQVHYVPVYRHPWHVATYGDRGGSCPEAERYYAGCLSLPCFPAMTDAEQDTVIDEVRAAVGA